MLRLKVTKGRSVQVKTYLNGRVETRQDDGEVRQPGGVVQGGDSLARVG